MNAAIDRLAWALRLSEDALRAAALSAEPDAADAFTDRAAERASQVEQVQALDRPHGATAAALPPMPHAALNVAEAEAALRAECRALLDDPATEEPARRVAESVEATCR